MTFSAERAYYENSALWDPKLYSGVQEERSSLTAKWLPTDVRSVLDAGCGNGVLTNLLDGQTSVVGIDRSYAALQWVSSSKCQGDLVELPFADNTFDAVVSTEVLEHLPTPLFAQVLDEMVRVTRRYILISVPYDEDLEIGRVTCPYCGCRFHRNYHMRKFSEQEIRNLFSHKPAVQLQRSAYIFATCTPGAERAKQKWSAFCSCLGCGRSAFDSNLICPQCSYASPVRVSETVPTAKGQTSKGLRLGPLINRIVPAKKSYRWWLALYTKSAALHTYSIGVKSRVENSPAND